MCGYHFQIGARDQDLHRSLEQKIQIGPPLIQTDDPLILGELHQSRLPKNLIAKFSRHSRQPR